MRRPDGSTTCAKGLHSWVEENIYTEPKSGKKICKLCRQETKKKPPEERRQYGTNHCARGHEYTPENTQKKVKIVNGVKNIVRTCITCKKREGNHAYYGTGSRVNR